MQNHKAKRLRAEETVEDVFDFQESQVQSMSSVSSSFYTPAERDGPTAPSPDTESQMSNPFPDQESQQSRNELSRTSTEQDISSHHPESTAKSLYCLARLPTLIDTCESHRVPSARVIPGTKRHEGNFDSLEFSYRLINYRYWHNRLTSDRAAFQEIVLDYASRNPTRAIAVRDELLAARMRGDPSPYDRDFSTEHREEAMDSVRRGMLFHPPAEVHKVISAQVVPKTFASSVEKRDWIAKEPFADMYSATPDLWEPHLLYAYLAKRRVVCMGCHEEVGSNYDSEEDYDYVDEWIIHRNTCIQVLVLTDLLMAAERPKITRKYEIDKSAYRNS